MLVSARNISKAYGNVAALHPMSFSVEEGDIVGLLGANGGGKTTLLRLVAGLLEIDAGALEVLGGTAPGKGRDFYGNISYMAQRFTVYRDLTVFENLRFRADVYAVDDRDTLIKEVLSRFELHPYRDTLAGRLSGGWARALQLATSVLHAPKLLLLDEPTAGLDAAARQRVWQHIRELAGQGIGIIISTHDLIEALQCSHALFLSRGEMLAKGSPHDIVASSQIRTYIIKNIDINSLFDVLDNIVKHLSCVQENGDLRLVLHADEHAALIALLASRNIDYTEVRPTLIDASAGLLAQQSSVSANVPGRVEAS